MSMFVRLLLIPSIGLALLTACDPRAEGETSLSPAEDLSAAELIQRILESEKSITSIREDRTDRSTQVAVPMDEIDTTPEESTTLRIQVGDDSYINYDYPGPDSCESGPSCVDLMNPLNETLYYQGTSYYRDSSGDWVLEPESGCPENDPLVNCISASIPIEHWLGEDGTGGFVESCPALESIEPPEPSQVYSFEFSWLASPEVIEDDSDDSGLVHVRGAIDEPFWSLGLTPEIQAAYAECGIDPEEIFRPPELSEPVPSYFPVDFRDYFPERYEGVADLWIDPVTHYVHRIDWSLDAFNKDRLLQSDKTSARYSLFNEAQLPGPLPD